MSEIRKIVCDVCGMDIKNGQTIAPSHRRRIYDSRNSRGDYRFDICDDCFERIKKECRKVVAI